VVVNVKFLNKHLIDPDILDTGHVFVVGVITIKHSGSLRTLSVMDVNRKDISLIGVQIKIKMVTLIIVHKEFQK